MLLEEINRVLRIKRVSFLQIKDKIASHVCKYDYDIYDRQIT